MERAAERAGVHTCESDLCASRSRLLHLVRVGRRREGDACVCERQATQGKAVGVQCSADGGQVQMIGINAPQQA